MSRDAGCGASGEVIEAGVQGCRPRARTAAQTTVSCAPSRPLSPPPPLLFIGRALAQSGPDVTARYRDTNGPRIIRDFVQLLTCPNHASNTWDIERAAGFIRARHLRPLRRVAGRSEAVAASPFRSGALHPRVRGRRPAEAVRLQGSTASGDYPEQAQGH
jgi:hypothetical protein